MSELADEADSKSVVGNNVRVQVPPPAFPEYRTGHARAWSVLYYEALFCDEDMDYAGKPVKESSITDVIMWI